jgi:hypothetical protein
MTHQDECPAINDLTALLIEHGPAACGTALATLLNHAVYIECWRKAHNTVRPHNSLGYRPPVPESRRPCPLALAPP